jgi:hypothetical protein
MEHPGGGYFVHRYIPNVAVFPGRGGQWSDAELRERERDRQNMALLDVFLAYDEILRRHLPQVRAPAAEPSASARAKQD